MEKVTILPPPFFSLPSLPSIKNVTTTMNDKNFRRFQLNGHASIVYLYVVVTDQFVVDLDQG